jgi:hypothetical protein
VRIEVDVICKPQTKGEGHFMNILPYTTEEELLKSKDKVQEFNGIGVWVKKFKRRS